MKAIKLLSAVGLTWLCATTLHAQETEIELDPITVTASLHPVSSSVTGRNIIVIKGDQFSKLPVNSVDELLRYLPGLEVQMRGPMGAQSDIVLRGGTFQQVLVILDGIRINDPNTGHFNSYIPIAPAEIDRIEVLKGASSAIYGSEAVGGVIQIITKSFAAKTGQKSKQLIAQGTAGQFGLLNGQFGGFYQNGNTAVSGGIISNNASGQQQRGTRGYLHNTSASVSINHYLDPYWNISYRSSFDRRDFAAQNFYTTFRSDTANEKVSTFWNQLKLAFEKEHQSFSVNLGYKAVKDQYQFNSVGTPNLNKSNLLQGLAIYKWLAASNTTITTGSQWVNKQMTSNDRGDHTLNQAGSFLIVDEKIGTHATVSPAIRVEWNERSGWQFVPQLNVSYKLPYWQLRGSAGRTTRDADFTERFNNYNKSFVQSGSIGNPDLASENSFSYEAGADFFGLKNLKLSATIFQQRFTKLIDYVTTPYAAMPRKENLSPTGTYALAQNIGQVNSTGAELDIQYSKKFQDNQQLWATFGFTWIDSKSNNTTPSFYLSSHAKYLANFNIRYTVNRFSFSLNGLYKQRTPQTSTAINADISTDYFVLNAQLQAFVYRNKVSIFTQADNLFDKQYSDLLGSQMPKRWLMGGFKVTL
ncbi:TonB-dependent receptor plug domain-containing protein [Segetibacter aerophilus]|uniref:TonB-dependent receptor n=1 Tax=Segetibacter aerophilus TaxID=670293 RepID=A0A512B8P4_9BACT|nr:TonB-dependent receptor [Segetibacter aerophilus]GEO08335.1 TonB-dependent receptor [Segetibacter aerophilus]